MSRLEEIRRRQRNDDIPDEDIDHLLGLVDEARELAQRLVGDEVPWSLGEWEAWLAKLEGSGEES